MVVIKLNVFNFSGALMNSKRASVWVEVSGRLGDKNIFPSMERVETSLFMGCSKNSVKGFVIKTWKLACMNSGRDVHPINDSSNYWLLEITCCADNF